MEIQISEIKKELSSKLDKDTLNTLLGTTFKGLQENTAKTAMLSAMIQGWTFQDFLVKNVYALPFNDKNTGGQTFSLVTSIDYARKIGMKSGFCGKSAPIFEEKDGQIISCTITVKRKIQDYIGEYSATVYMSEYGTGKQLWASKPRTMLAKVAEMHALRMACPEEASQMYVEEEYAQPMNIIEVDTEQKENRIFSDKMLLSECKNLYELGKVWSSLSAESKVALLTHKDELKQKYASETI